LKKKTGFIVCLDSVEAWSEALTCDHKEQRKAELNIFEHPRGVRIE